MTGKDLLKAIGSASDENLLLAESVPLKNKTNRLWIIAAAAAVLVLCFGMIALNHFAKKPADDRYADASATPDPNAEIITEAPATQLPPATSAVAEPTGQITAEPMQPPPTELPAPVTSSEPPPEFTVEGYMIYGTTANGDRYALESEEQLVDEYVHGCRNSFALRNLFSMRGGEYYFIPASLPDDAVLLMIIPHYLGNLCFLYYSESDPSQRYVFEWVSHDDPTITEDYTEWLESNPNFEKTDDLYIRNTVGYCDPGYKDIYLIRDGRVFHAAMPITAEIEEIRSFIDPVMVMLPDPDPACIDELTFRSMDECLDAIAANTSAESVLAGLEGIYTLKNGEGRISRISVKRDAVTVHFSDEEERALYYLTMYRHADPDNDWLLGTAQSDPLYSFCCDIKLNSSEYIYLVYDTILHPNLYWIENGRAFRLYMYFGEEETDLSQENVIELCKVILHSAAN
ncbi:MAG: hypothetical protein J5544_05795 [Clostridia bacterium]|nr:hypothetical protein [Clostridia bacterium]